MIYLALINVWLIGLDFTYLWLRPLYFDYLPRVVEIYDPVKGIEPHPLTARYLERVDRLGAALATGAPRATIEADLAELQELSRQLFTSKPFDRSGQSRNLGRLEARTRLFFDAGIRVLRGADAFERLWAPGPGLADRLAFFQRELRPLLAVNYHRELRPRRRA